MFPRNVAFSKVTWVMAWALVLQTWIMMDGKTFI